MAVGRVSIALIGLACTVLIVALWFGKNEENETQKRLQLILEGLLNTEKQVSERATYELLLTKYEVNPWLCDRGLQ